MSVILIRVRRASETTRRTQIQIPKSLANSSVFGDKKEVVSLHDGVVRSLRPAAARNITNTIKLEVPEIATFIDPILKFVLKDEAVYYEALDAANESSKDVVEFLKNGIANKQTSVTLPKKPEMSTWWRIMNEDPDVIMPSERPDNSVIISKNVLISEEDSKLGNALATMHKAELSTFTNQQTTLKAGFVYIGDKREDWPNAVKVGKAIDFSRRENSFFQSYPYGNFMVRAATFFEDRAKAEAAVHSLLESKRTEPRKEWFMVSVEEANDAINQVKEAWKSRSLEVVSPKFSETALIS